MSLAHPSGPQTRLTPDKVDASVMKKDLLFLLAVCGIYCAALLFDLSRPSPTDQRAAQRAEERELITTHLLSRDPAHKSLNAKLSALHAEQVERAPQWLSEQLTESQTSWERFLALRCIAPPHTFNRRCALEELQNRLNTLSAHRRTRALEVYVVGRYAQQSPHAERGGFIPRLITYEQVSKAPTSPLSDEAVELLNAALLPTQLELNRVADPSELRVIERRLNHSLSEVWGVRVTEVVYPTNPYQVTSKTESRQWFLRADFKYLKPEDVLKSKHFSPKLSNLLMNARLKRGGEVSVRSSEYTQWTSSTRLWDFHPEGIVMYEKQGEDEYTAHTLSWESLLSEDFTIQVKPQPLQGEGAL